MRIISLDLLRGIAAFGIVGCHLSLSPRSDGGALVTSLCDFNVGLFAALAGFLMSGAIMRDTSKRGWCVSSRRIYFGVWCFLPLPRHLIYC